jgi:hypothetical protein
MVDGDADPVQFGGNIVTAIVLLEVSTVTWHALLLQVPTAFTLILGPES